MIYPTPVVVERKRNKITKIKALYSIKKMRKKDALYEWASL